MIGKSEQPLADNPLFRPGEEIETMITAIETAQDIPGPFKPVHDITPSVSNLFRIDKSTAAIDSLEGAIYNPSPRRWPAAQV
jgi:hypothetical protein